MQNCDKRLHCQSQATSCGEEESAERTENLSYRRGKVPQQRRNKLFADMSMQPHLYTIARRMLTRWAKYQ